jgi:hypothetical protein
VRKVSRFSVATERAVVNPRARARASSFVAVSGFPAIAYARLPGDLIGVTEWELKQILGTDRRLRLVHVLAKNAD